MPRPISHVPSIHGSAGHHQLFPNTINHNAAVAHWDVLVRYIITRRTDAFPVKLVLCGAKVRLTSFEPTIANETVYCFGKKSIFAISQRIHWVAAPRVRFAMPAHTQYAQILHTRERQCTARRTNTRADRHTQFFTPWSGRPSTNVGNPKSKKAPNNFMPK